MGIRSRIKPPLWAISPAFAAPKWGWFWNPRPLFMMLPWQIVGDVRDFIGSPLALTGTPLLKTGLAGRFLEYDGAQYNERDSFPALSYPFTMIALTRSFPPFTSTESNFFLTLVDSSAAEKIFGLRRLRTDSGGAGIHGAFHRNTTFGESTITLSNGLQTFDPLLIAGVFANSTSVVLFADSQQGTEETTSVPMFTVNRISIGRLGDSTPLNSDRDCGVYWAAVLPQAISVNQFRQLEADPFGPFRMLDEVVVLGAVAAAAASKPPSGLALLGVGV